jgi:glutathione S-transferase
MKLYVGILSLFSGKARIALAEKGVAPELVFVTWSRERRYLPHHPDVVALNPNAQVPVLVDTDTVVYDSTQIFEYLEDRIPEPALYPRDPRQRARCRQLEAEGDELWFPCVWDLIEARFYADGSGSEVAAASAQRRLATLYLGLEKVLADRDFALGAFSAADISIFIQVQAAIRLGAAPDEQLTGVRAWVERVGARPSVAPVLADMTQAARDAMGLAG